MLKKNAAIFFENTDICYNLCFPEGANFESLNKSDVLMDF